MHISVCFFQGNLVYVNYGRVEDFQKLTGSGDGELNVNLTGKIAIARYGKIFRGDKVSIFASIASTKMVCS